MNNIKLSIIAPVYNLNDKMVKVTENMISDINHTRPQDSEFIIVDNGSTKSSEMMVEKSDIYVRTPQNLGWGGALNMGMKLAHGEYFVFVNNDIRITEEWSKFVIERFEKVPKTGAISVHNREGFSGAFFAIRKEVYEKVGLFDEKNFPLGHAQDCDYLYRMILEGWNIHVIVLKSFYHTPRSTYNQPEFKEKYAFHPNFGKSTFKEKHGFKEQDWLKMGNIYWREKIEKNPKLDRFNELKHFENWLVDYNKTMDTIGCTFLGRPVGQTFSSLFIWEKILTHYKFKRIIEFGSWKGNLSLYLFLYCLSENAEFYTYDKEKIPTYFENKNDILKSRLDYDKHFYQVDIFKKEIEIKNIIQKEGRSILFCDNGKKVKEFNIFANFLKKDDIVGVHDWNSEVKMKQIEDTCQKCRLKMIFEKECSDNNTATRFFIKYE